MWSMSFIILPSRPVSSLTSLCAVLAIFSPFSTCPFGNVHTLPPFTAIRATSIPPSPPFSKIPPCPPFVQEGRGGVLLGGGGGISAEDNTTRRYLTLCFHSIAFYKKL